MSTFGTPMQYVPPPVIPMNPSGVDPNTAIKQLGDTRTSQKQASLGWAEMQQRGQLAGQELDQRQQEFQGRMAEEQRQFDVSREDDLFFKEKEQQLALRMQALSMKHKTAWNKAQLAATSGNLLAHQALQDEMDDYDREQEKLQTQSLTLSSLKEAQRSLTGTDPTQKNMLAGLFTQMLQLESGNRNELSMMNKQIVESLNEHLTDATAPDAKTDVGLLGKLYGKMQGKDVVFSPVTEKGFVKAAESLARAGVITPDGLSAASEMLKKAFLASHAPAGPEKDMLASEAAALYSGMKNVLIADPKGGDPYKRLDKALLLLKEGAKAKGGSRIKTEVTKEALAAGQEIPLFENGKAPELAGGAGKSFDAIAAAISQIALLPNKETGDKLARYLNEKSTLGLNGLNMNTAVRQVINHFAGRNPADFAADLSPDDIDAISQAFQGADPAVVQKLIDSVQTDLEEARAHTRQTLDLLDPNLPKSQPEIQQKLEGVDKKRSGSRSRLQGVRDRNDAATFGSALATDDEILKEMGGMAGGDPFED